jgi:hypothetical protein
MRTLQPRPPLFYRPPFQMICRALLLLLLLTAICPVSSAQTVPPAGRVGASKSTGSGVEPPYRREFVYGVTSTSNSGIIAGGGIRASRYWKPDWLWFWSLQVNEVKNRKELRLQSVINGDPFIKGKTNYLYALRPSFGLERVVLHKAAEQGVQVSALLSAGPSIGLEVPYYVFYVYDPDPLPLIPVDVRREQHDPKRAQYTTGLAEARPIPGLHLRASVAFEYGRYRESVTGIEAGAMLEAYSRKPLLIPQTANQQVFSSVFLTLFFGRRN